MTEKCGSNKKNIKEHILAQTIEECAVFCHQTLKCVSFYAKSVENDYVNFECALKDNRQIIKASNCDNKYDFQSTFYYVLNVNKTNVRLLNDESTAFEGRVQMLFNTTNSVFEWGAVLSKGFDDNAANVLCRI